MAIYEKRDIEMLFFLVRVFLRNMFYDILESFFLLLHQCNLEWAILVSLHKI